MHRFFIEQAARVGDTITFDTGQSRHIRRVLRLSEGAEVIAFNGQGFTCRAVLADTNAREITAVVAALLDEERESPLRVVLAQGLVKGERMEFILQKAVELGASAIQPFASRHAVVELKGERAEKKVQRWQSIALEACKQCRRNTVPPVEMPLDFIDLLELIGERPAVILYENETGQGLKPLLQAHKREWREQELYIIVGPEGGFSADEVKLARDRGCHFAGLGPRILRTETAALVALAVVMYEFDGLEP